MEERPNRVRCEECGADNFLSAEKCWKCGRAFPVRESGEAASSDERAGSREEPVERAPCPPPRRGDGYEGSSSNSMSIVGFVCAGMGFSCCPLFSVAAIVLGVIAASKREKLATWVLIAGVFSVILYSIPILFGLGSVFTSFPRTGPGPGP